MLEGGGKIGVLIKVERQILLIMQWKQSGNTAFHFIE